MENGSKALLRAVCSFIILVAVGVTTSSNSLAQNQKLGQWRADTTAGQANPILSDPIEACKISHDSYGVNAGLTVSAYWPRYSTVDGSINGYSCDIASCTPDDCYGYHGTSGSATLLSCGDDENGEGYQQTNSGEFTCQKASNPTGQKCVGDPIEVVSGTLMESLPLSQTADGRLSISLHFSSQSQFRGKMGNGWRHNYARDYRYGRNIETIRTGVQRDYWFAKDYPSGWNIANIRDGKWTHTYTAAQGDAAKLTSEDSAHRELKREDGSIETYRYNASDIGWKLESIKYVGGYTQDFTYDADARTTTLTDSFGRSVVYKRNQMQLIEEIVDFNGQSFKFEYTSKGELLAGDTSNWGAMPQLINAVLSKVIFPDNTPDTDDDNPTYIYHYEDETNSINLTGKTDERGVRLATWAFIDGQAVSYTGPNGHGSVSIEYDDATKSRVITNAKGHKQTIRYTKTFRGIKKMTAAEGQGSSNCAPSNVNYVIENGYVKQETEAEGQVKTYVRNAEGFPTRIMEAAGTPEERVTNIEWNEEFYQPSKITGPLLETSFTYDDDGNVTSIAEKDVASGQTRTTNMTYAGNGLVTRIDGPLSGTADATNFTYDANGYVKTVTNGLGHTTQITSVNGRGQPLSTVDPNGVVSSFAYNARGWVTSINVNGSRTTSFSYDDAGNMTGMTLPSGGSYSYTYNDVENLTSIVSSMGEVTNFTHDVEGNVTSQTRSGGSGSGFSESYVFDDINRLMEVVDAQGHVSRLLYDRSDRLTGMVDGLNQQTNYGFDALNRVISMIDPQGDVEASGLTSDGDLESFADGNGTTTNFVRNGFGEVLQEISPDRGTRTYTRDLAGRVTSISDSEDNQVTYTYDGLGRILTESFAGDASLNRSYVYDTGSYAKGRMSRANDAEGYYAYEYNSFGEVVKETRSFSGGGGTHVTQYAYDALGQVTSIVYPSGHEVMYTQDAFGRVTDVKARGTSTDPETYVYDIATGVTRKSFGPVTGYTAGNGLTVTYGYDQSYKLNNYTVGWGGYPFVLNQNVYFDAANKITGIHDLNDGLRSGWYGHYSDGRLFYAVGPWGDFGWEYDSAGNRTLERRTYSESNEVYDHYEYQEGTNKLLEVNDGGTLSSREFTYLANGNVATDNRGANGAYQYTHDASGRLSAISENGTPLANYAYDALGRRISRDVSGEDGLSRRYIFNLAHQPIVELDENGATVREYIWMNDRLVAMVDVVSQWDYEISYVHTGHLGQPLRMTSQTGVLVWDANVEPFGKASAVHDVKEIELRLPGQWEQFETGLLQNHWRDYDPTLGRYLDADPIGLGGGANPFGYVAGKPLSAIDPLGLDIIVFNRGFLPFMDHQAAAIGNDNDGWTFNSKDGYGKFTWEKYDSLEELLELSDAKNYKNAWRRKTEGHEDYAMKLGAEKELFSDYSFITANCGDVIEGALANAGFGYSNGVNPMTSQIGFLLSPNWRNARSLIGK